MGRLVDLPDRPADIPVLGPLYLRELLYRVLSGPRGGFLRAVCRSPVRIPVRSAPRFA